MSFVLFQEVKSSLEEFGQSGIVCVQENVQEMQNIVKKTEEVVKHSEAVINSTANRLKEEILQRDNEFEKFISEDLLKDIPTGKQLFTAFTCVIIETVFDREKNERKKILVYNADYINNRRFVNLKKICDKRISICENLCPQFFFSFLKYHKIKISALL